MHDAAATTMLYRSDPDIFRPHVNLGIQPQEFNLGFIRPNNFIFHAQSPLGARWQTPSMLSCAFYWGVASVWPLYHKGLIGGVLQRWLSLWKVLPSPKRNSGALSEWPLGSWSPPWLRPFSPNCSVWPGRQPSLGRVLVVLNFFHWRMMEATVSLGTFNTAEMFCFPSPDLCIDTILSRSSMVN